MNMNRVAMPGTVRSQPPTLPTPTQHQPSRGSTEGKKLERQATEIPPNIWKLEKEATEVQN